MDQLAIVFLLLTWLLVYLCLFLVFQVMPQTALADCMFPELRSTNWTTEAAVVLGLLYLPALALSCALVIGISQVLPKTMAGSLIVGGQFTIPATLVAACNFLAALVRLRKHRHPKKGLLELWMDPEMFGLLRKVALWAVLTSVPMAVVTLCGGLI